MDSAEKPLENLTETVADACFSHLVQHPEDLQRFMGETGYTPETIGKAVGTSAFAAGMIEFFVRSEPLLLVLCANAGFRPEQIVAVWRRLNPEA